MAWQTDRCFAEEYLPLPDSDGDEITTFELVQSTKGKTHGELLMEQLNRSLKNIVKGFVYCRPHHFLKTKEHENQLRPFGDQRHYLIQSGDGQSETHTDVSKIVLVSTEDRYHMFVTRCFKERLQPGPSKGE